MPKRGLARHWGIEASRFGAKRGSRCCELSRNEGLRCCGIVATGLGVSTPFFYCVSRSAFGPWLLTPHGAWLSGAQAAVALAMPGLALPGAGSNCSRRTELGFPERGQQFLAPHRAWLFGACAAVAIAARRPAAGGECGERVRKRCANPTIRAALAMQKWQTRADAGQM